MKFLDYLSKIIQADTFEKQQDKREKRFKKEVEKMTKDVDKEEKKRETFSRQVKENGNDSTVRKQWAISNKHLMKKYNITQRDIENSKNKLLKTHELLKTNKVDKKYLEFVFIWELYEGRIDLVFNIIDPKHKHYKSSVNFKFIK
jgi:hypothetical protein